MRGRTFEWSPTNSGFSPRFQGFASKNPSEWGYTNNQFHKSTDKNYVIREVSEFWATIRTVEIILPLVAKFRFVEITCDADTSWNHIEHRENKNLNEISLGKNFETFSEFCEKFYWKCSDVKFYLDDKFFKFLGLSCLILCFDCASDA